MTLLDYTLPKVGVVVIDSRGNSNKEWVEQCISSIRSQYYRNLDITVIDNKDKLYTIGKCRNDGVKQSDPECKWILFVDDDDWISKEYVLNMLLVAQEHDTNNTLKWVGSGCFFVYPEEIQYRIESPIGMWKREFLVENPFPEYLMKHEDVELSKKLKAGDFIHAKHITGYFYRQHREQNSGEKLKLIKKEEAQCHSKKDIQALSQEIDEILKNSHSWKAQSTLQC